MIKTGIVMCITNKKAGIMTSSGEFVYVKANRALPIIGEIHTGKLCTKSLLTYKYAITAASLMFILLSSTFAYAYYTPATTVVLSINPSVSLKANRWNRIISFKALNSDGVLILSKIKLKNKSIDAGLELLIKEAKTENFINDKYEADKKIVSVDFVSNKDNTIDISNFKNILDSNKLNVKINARSANNKNIAITVNNKRIDTSNLNSNYDKEEPINNKVEPTSKNSNTKENPRTNYNSLKKPLIDNNSKKINSVTTKTEDKSSNIKYDSKISNEPISNKKNEIQNYIRPQDKIYNNEKPNDTDKDKDNDKYKDNYKDNTSHKKD